MTDVLLPHRAEGRSVDLPRGGRSTEHPPAIAASPQWHVAIFAARESLDVLLPTLEAALLASAGVPSLIDVLINGNPALADELANALGDRLAGRLTAASAVRIWRFAVPDKAHTWNAYLHRICPAASVNFCVDGYARVRPDALGALAKRLDDEPQALAATGVPSRGPSARKLAHRMLTEGGIHGNLHALSQRTVERLKAIGFRLPAGLYRTDGTLGAVINFDLRPELGDWNPKRIAVVQAASWDLPPDPLLTPAALKARYHRLFRQAQGQLESRAVQAHLRSGGSPAALGAQVTDLIERWSSAHPQEATALKRSPFVATAWRRLRSMDPAALERLPELVGQWPAR